ncbi:MAG TPA: hypothetical protein PKA64_09035 [Myxococcota bacterium]|nr:hypothetical protein [Myxococcota bacterium]
MSRTMSRRREEPQTNWALLGVALALFGVLGWVLLDGWSNYDEDGPGLFGD